MARDDYYMGSLAGLDAYRGDEPAWPDAPQPMGAVANPWADFMSRDQPLPTHAPQQAPDKYQRLAGGIASLPANAVHSFFGGPAAMNKPNPYPEGSDLAQHFENTRADVPYEYGPATAVGLFGMGPRVKGGLSATGGSEIVQPQPMGQLAKPFYSAAEQAVVGSPLTKAPPEQWLGTLRNTPGVKADELERLGLEQFLRQQPGAVPKQALADYVAANKVDVGEVRKRDPTGLNDSAMLDRTGGRSKFSSWQLPGGENYRETLLTMPGKKVEPSLEEIEHIAKTRYEGYHRKENDPPWERIAPDIQRLYREDANAKIIAAESHPQFTAGHFSEPNVLVHYRTNDRVIDGKKTLFLEEVQSDWHQKGREQGYRAPEAERAKMEAELQALQAERAKLVGSSDPADRARYEAAANREGELTDLYNKTIHDAIPDAPFKTTWHELALKRAIRDAAEGGYDQIAWTPGSVQNARYDLSKQVSNISYNTSENTLQAFDKSGSMVMNSRVEPKDLPNHIGKDAADKILNNPTATGKDRYGVWHRLSGVDLQMGGEGMRGFYDKMLPAAANKLGKKHGAQVEQQFMDKPYIDQFGKTKQEQTQPVHVLPLTPSLREQALRKGFPLFVTGGVTTMGALAAQDRYANQ